LSDQFVVDASVGFSWVYPSQASTATDQLLVEIEGGAVVIVPSLWFLEVANGLLAAQRRRLITAAERKGALARLSNLAFTVDEQTVEAAFRKTSELAERYGLSVYDAAYLETAVRRKLPLASRDRPLRTAAKRCGIKLRV
jgi:predicted nucleic acid-binding protein